MLVAEDPNDSWDPVATYDPINDRIWFSDAYGRLMKQEEQKGTIRDWEKQESVNSLLVDRIVGSVNPQYLEVRNKEYTGFAGETTKTLIAYIRTAWCRVSTQYKMKARNAFREPWDQTSHIATYAR